MRLLMVAVLSVAIGCSGAAYEYDSVVMGTVTIDGELANQGTVAFHQVGEGRAALGRIYSDGSYSLRTGQGDLSKADGGTVMSGDYLVTVNISAPAARDADNSKGGPPIPGPSLIAPKYASKETTDLRYTVKPGKQVINLNLERAQPPVAQEGQADSPQAEGTATENADADADKAAPAGAAESQNNDQGENETQ